MILIDIHNDYKDVVQSVLVLSVLGGMLYASFCISTIAFLLLIVSFWMERKGLDKLLIIRRLKGKK